MIARFGDPLAWVPRAGAYLVGGLVFLEGWLVLLGWQGDNPGLRSVIPGLVAMNPLTAVCLILAAVALGLLAAPKGRRSLRWAGRGVALVVLLLGLLKLGSFVGWDAGVDQALFADKLAAYVPPNRMAPNTTLNVVLVGLALLLLDVETARRRRPAQVLALITCVSALFALVGYAYGVSALYDLLAYIPMALNTALAFLLLGLGILCARPDQGLAAVATSPSAGGVAVRRLLPAAIAIPAIVGWLALQGQRAGLYDTSFAVSCIVVVSIVVLAAPIWQTGALLAGVDVARRRAELERERQYREAEDARGQVRAVLDAVNEAIVFLAPDRRILGINRRFTELFGPPAARVLGLNAAELRADVAAVLVDPTRLAPAADSAADDPEERVGACEVTVDRHALEVFSAPVRGVDERRLGRLYAIRDVTAQREVERLKEERRRRLEEELARAAQIQADLLPRDVPLLPGLELAARCLPAREVGGDFFDWHESAAGVLTLTLGDVMGKGMPAALLMATVRAALEAVARQSSPALAVQTVAAALERDLDHAASFVTLFHAAIDVAARQVDFVDAGHGHLLLRRAGGAVAELGPHGVPLGVLAEPRYQAGRCHLAPGDALVVYSDGLLDARPELELTPDALARCLDGAASAGDMVDRLVELARPAGPLPDDLTLVVLRCREEG